MRYTSYYHQTPIMKKILDFLGDAVYVKGTEPGPYIDKPFRRYNDIMHAVDDGSDLHRSNLDFRNLVLMIDVEYNNRDYPGEIFHNPLDTFRKLEPTRDSIKNMLDKSKVRYIETMTGQGYNYTMAVDRDSATYNSLLTLGKKMRVLPWTAAKKLLEKQDTYQNLPLLKDHVASTAFGRLNDYMFDTVSQESELLARTSDVFDDDEIVIFDTSLHGYLLNRRAFRIAFSLHQKSRMSDKYGYKGPPIVTLPVTGLPLEERVKIRQDERNDFERAVRLARESDTRIPETDLTGLITDYLLSDRSSEHLELADSLGSKEIEDKDLVARIEEELPGFDEYDVSWGVPDMPDWNRFGELGLPGEVWDMFGKPNDTLLNPGALRYVIRELSDRGVEDKEIISAIAQKYREDHGWSVEITKNDPLLRAEYWVRTLKEQL